MTIANTVQEVSLPNSWEYLPRHISSQVMMPTSCIPSKALSSTSVSPLHRDTTGTTLIPPTLREFATTFAGDLKASLGIEITVVEGSERGSNTIFLTLGDEKQYRDVAGRPTGEGYTLTTATSGIVITGASPLGVWWGTRTLLQQAALHEGAAIPIGTGVDAPGWRVRGMMLDVGRHFYPKDFVIDMCAYMSFFKQNTFHLHLSDNIVGVKYTPETFKDIYARFRLFSESSAVAGLNKYRNESYTRDEFEEIQTKCAARGVTILPELEAPGHALAIVQWRPQIGYSGDLSLLNISHPDTIPTVKTIWKEFLPWFHSKVVSIGADEYNGPVDEYKKFVNVMDAFIAEQSGKTMQIWGTFPPKKGANPEVFRNVTIQHWSFSFGNPLHEYLKSNYSVVNSDDAWYIVSKSNGGYGRTIDISKTFHGDPANRGPWYPNIFSQSKASENPARTEPRIQGSIMALWNDRGANTSVYSEAYYAWRDGIPALADKQWGGQLTEDQFADVVAKLHPHIPAQNLERAIPSKGSTIFEYDLSRQQYSGVRDMSLNGYNAVTTCKSDGSSLKITPDCTLTTPWASKGRSYTLSLSLKVDKLANPTNTTLITGSDSALVLTPEIALFAGGNYYRLKSKISLGQWVDLEIRGRGARTFAVVTSPSGGKPGQEEEFLARIGTGGSFYSAEIAIEAPIKRVTGWTGELKKLKLTNEA